MLSFIIVLFFLSGVFLFFLFFLLETIVVKLKDNNPFKIWWRKNICEPYSDSAD